MLLQENFNEFSVRILVKNIFNVEDWKYCMTECHMECVKIFIAILDNLYLIVHI